MSGTVHTYQERYAAVLAAATAVAAVTNTITHTQVVYIQKEAQELPVFDCETSRIYCIVRWFCCCFQEAY
jgi:hypothetical protein